MASRRPQEGTDGCGCLVMLTALFLAAFVVALAVRMAAAL